MSSPQNNKQKIREVIVLFLYKFCLIIVALINFSVFICKCVSQFIDKHTITN